MRIHFYSNMRTIAGQDSFDIFNADDIVTLRDLIIRLVGQFPDFHSQLFDADNNLRQDVPIFVNGRNPRLNGAMDAPLQPNDLVSLFSPISSGKLNVEAIREPATQKRNETMKINFFATLRDIAGGKTVEIPIDHGATAREVLEAIVTKFPAMKKELFHPNGRMFGHVHFFVNGRDVQFMEDDLETRILPEDVISIFPAVGGGSLERS